MLQPTVLNARSTFKKSEVEKLNTILPAVESLRRKGLEHFY